MNTTHVATGTKNISIHNNGNSSVIVKNGHQAEGWIFWMFQVAKMENLVYLLKWSLPFLVKVGCSLLMSSRWHIINCIYGVKGFLGSFGSSVSCCMVFFPAEEMRLAGKSNIKMVQYNHQIKTVPLKPSILVLTYFFYHATEPQSREVTVNAKTPVMLPSSQNLQKCSKK